MQKELKWKQWKILLSWAPKSLLYGDCTREIKMHLVHGTKVMAKLGSIFKTKDITLPTKVPYSQSHGFSSSQVWMRDLDHKEDKVLKNCPFKLWCWGRLESSLGSKTKTVHPKGNQPCIFVGRTDAETETPVLATWDEELTHWKRPWCWESLKASGEEGSRRWDGWMASLTQWTWVWANSRRQWRAGKPGMLQSMGWQRLGHDLVTEQQ